MEQQDALVVIKQSDLDKLTRSAGVTYPTFPASEVFDKGFTKGYDYSEDKFDMRGQVKAAKDEYTKYANTKF